jgi:hypothetical protein
VPEGQRCVGLHTEWDVLVTVIVNAGLPWPRRLLTAFAGTFAFSTVEA